LFRTLTCKNQTKKVKNYYSSKLCFSPNDFLFKKKTKAKFMNEFISKIPNIKKYPLGYIFEDLNYQHKTDSLWLEFGVASGRTINYFSKFTQNTVYGFDSFEGLPSKWRDGFDIGAFNQHGKLPVVNSNVVLVKGWFSNTLKPFLMEKNQKVSFVHIDCDLYSSTKFVLDELKDFFDNECVLVFDELVNYPGFMGETGELLALYEFIRENNIEYEWIGMNGTLGNCNENHVCGSAHEKVALCFKKKNL
jgi:hypothetical protein